MTQPVLHAEYRIRVSRDSGDVVRGGYATIEEAEAGAQRLAEQSGFATWVVEYRLVSDWRPLRPAKTRGR